MGLPFRLVSLVSLLRRLVSLLRRLVSLLRRLVSLLRRRHWLRSLRRRRQLQPLRHRWTRCDQLLVGLLRRPHPSLHDRRRPLPTRLCRLHRLRLRRGWWARP